MASITELWNNELVEASNYTINANEVVDLLTSGGINNLADNSVKVTVMYKELTPTGIVGNFYISAILEVEGRNGIWRPTPCYQFAPLRFSSQAPQRIMVMQPDMDTFNLGIDDSIQSADEELCRVSRTQGKLPAGQKFRVKIQLKDKDPNGSNPFESVKISGEVEVY